MTYPALTPGGSLVVAWQLRGRRVLLVGGGDVAAGRLFHLKNADAHVTVLCPREGLCAEMKHRMDVDHAVDTYIPEAYSSAVSYTHLTLPTNTVTCRSRWSPYH